MRVSLQAAKRRKNAAQGANPGLRSGMNASPEAAKEYLQDSLFRALYIVYLAQGLSCAD